MGDLRVGVVGAAGNRAALAELFDDHDGAAVVAACDTDEDGLERAAAEWGVEATYREYETMLADAALDAVYVATPQNRHARHSISALECGIHVLSEVPAAVSMAEARKLVAAAENSGATYTLGENVCYYREHVLVRELVAAGLFGEPYYTEGAYIHDLKGRTDATPWRRPHQLGTEGLSYPTHQAGPVLQWFPDDRIKRITCAGSGYHYADDYAQDTAVLLGRTERGRLVKLRQDIISNRPPPKRLNQYQLQGTRGCFVTPSGRTPGGSEAIDMVWLETLHETDDPHDREFVDLMSLEEYLPERYRDPPEGAAAAGHFGSDYYLVADFLAGVREGDPPIGVHDAMDLTLPGIVSRQSVAGDDGWLAVPDSREW